MRRLSLFIVLVCITFAAEAQLVVPQGGAPTILIPAAGSVQGANGTFFRSDLTVLNYRNSTQNVQFQWMPQGSSGSTVAPITLQMGAMSGVTSEDFVASILHQTGLGAILITGVTSTGAADPNAHLMATSRIWTPQPNATTGTNSQQFNSIPLAAVGNGTLTIIGQRRDDRYRTNVGIVNLDSQPQTFRIDLQSSVGTESQMVDVPAMSLSQVSMLGPNSTLPLQILATSVSSTTARFMAYGSSVDNVTGDAWSSLGFNATVSQSAATSFVHLNDVP
jgi:hypothetical protein